MSKLKWGIMHHGIYFLSSSGEKIYVDLLASSYKESIICWLMLWPRFIILDLQSKSKIKEFKFRHFSPDSEIFCHYYRWILLFCFNYWLAESHFLISKLDSDPEKICFSISIPTLIPKIIFFRLRFQLRLHRSRNRNRNRNRNRVSKSDAVP